MRTRRAPHRRAQAGLTLIELLVTIALMATAVVGLVGLFSTIEIGVAATGDDAKLTALARQVGDVIESESFAYVPCTGPTGQAPAGLIKYETALRNVIVTSNTISIVSVQQAQSAGSSHIVSGAASPLQPINGCSAGLATGPDYGIQQITFKVSSSRNSLTRTLYKRWN